MINSRLKWNNYIVQQNETLADILRKTGASVRELAALGFSCVVLSRERIENNLWNYDYEGGTNVVDVYVGYLRKKIDAGFSKKLIHTVWGTGWVLRED